MNRRQFIRNTGLSLGAIFISDAILAGVYDHAAINYPDAVTAIIDNELVQLSGNGQQHWVYRNLLVDLKYKNQSLEVAITAPQCSLSAVTLHWKKTAQPTAVMNDHWERTYGDASWHAPAAAEMLPWYFMEQSENATHGFGVKTGTATFCSWQRTPAELRLTMDTRSGGDGVQLGNRQLLAAAIVTIKSHPHETAFAVARRFTKMMCAAANMPKKPVYGINDWYFTYGNNSEKLILEHTRLMAPMADGLENRPFSVIDAGWFVGPPSSPNDCCWGDRMDLANARFGGDMSKSAVNIKQAGMRPGIWTRPLCGSYQDPANIMLPMIKGREQNKPVLDPSIPENLERIKKYFRNYNEWGFEMVKFDFTTFDILGKWGFEMLHSCAMTSNNWRMQDNTKTNAEIILKMYTSIREAAGASYTIGCNTISHLSAGLFELNRIGDDTSGHEWERTRKMGVNTLAFRSVQHGTFYAADADCVGLTNQVPWDKNKQWMELVAKSGTPLFISAQPDATGDKQKQSIKESFRLASASLPVGEPLDWMENAFPKKWKLNGNIENFNWD